jgi:hypothetical protein
LPWVIAKYSFGPAIAVENVTVGLEHLALDWLDADAAPGEARSPGRQQRLVEQTADGELVGRLLAEVGVDVDAAVDVDGPGHHAADGTIAYTPLTCAAGHGHLEAVRLMLEVGADPDRVDGNCDTPLMHAAGGGHLEVLRVLLGRGVAVDVVEPEAGWTAFHYACSNNAPECAEALARAGCDVSIMSKCTQSSASKTGRELAEEQSHVAVVARLRAVVAEQLWAAQAAGAAPEPELEPAVVADDEGPVDQLLAQVAAGMKTRNDSV